MKKLCISIVSFLFILTGLVAQDTNTALRRYFNGRDLDNRGRTSDAVAEYNAAILMCLQVLESQPQNMDAYAVYTWSLYRLRKYADTVSVCRQALNIKEDPRIIETMGEALFYINNFDECLVQMQRYINMSPDGDRVAVAYFFEAEVYRNRNQYNKAEFLYTVATHFEPSIALWWFRLGFVREMIGNVATAIEAYTRAVALNPNYTEAVNALNRLQ
ncbi:MAG: tetratricopeptide repeat protein [Spirochaetaceae bacterium]|nr:tetratricopeptide repeat protein [Spirochaetaceae bacterium]